MSRRLRPPEASTLLVRAVSCATAGALALLVGSCSSRVAIGGGSSTLLTRLGARGATDQPDAAGRPLALKAKGRPEQADRAGEADRTAVLRVWKAEMDAFYTASETGDPSYPELYSGVIPGSPEDEQLSAYLSAQAASGVIGPTAWRLGNIRVVSLGRSDVLVTACSYDSGSRFRVSGDPAPATLGGTRGLTAYSTEMTKVRGTWKLERSVASAPPDGSSPGPCRGFAAAGSKGGGNGAGAGSTGSSIWSWVWWLGSPQGPGPYTGGTAGGLEICVWHDLGASMLAVNRALTNAGLPASFWQAPRSGGHPGIWAVDLWAAALLKRAKPDDHFDLVACPRPDQVPPSGGGVEAGIPAAKTPKNKVVHLWIFWDTVPDPPDSDLPPLVNIALARARLPAPVISTSPSSIDEFADATIVNFPTWFWIDQSAWRTVIATAAGGGLVATVWATPRTVTWRSAWSFPAASDDPEGGVTLLPEDLDLLCAGPGVAYDESRATAAQSSDCVSVFTQSTFGTYRPLEASISWQIHWALSDDSGVVGGEGFLAGSVSASMRPLRVLQVESVITQG